MSATASQRPNNNSARASAAATIGSIVEWYDFALYGASAALVFNYVFFDPAHPEASAVASFLTFAAGFLARPLGGVVFSHIGDRLGRRPT
jgi:MFS family permease